MLDPLEWEIKFYAIGMRQNVTGEALERFVDMQMRRNLMPRRQQLFLPLPKPEAPAKKDARSNADGTPSSEDG